MKMFKTFSALQPLARFGGVGAAALAIVLAGCSTDSPTAPDQGGQTPATTGGTAQWSITVTASPTTIELADGTPTSTIGVSIVHGSTGAAPPEGTLFQLRASHGTFGGESTVTGVLTRGGYAALFTADTAGTAIITATLEQSIGQKTISVIDPDDSVFVLTHMEPNIGSPDGGDIVGLFGHNIREPVSVTFGSQNAEILGVTSGRIRVRTPRAPSTVPVGSTLPVSVTATSGLGTQFQTSFTLGGSFVYTHGTSGNFPQIFSLEPDSGPVAGGTTVVARGSGFGDHPRVMMQADSGPVIELQQISNSETRVTFLTPAASSLAPASNWNGEAQVWIVDLNTGLSSGKQTFHYGATIFVSSIVPANGSPAGGLTVSIIGSGFEAPMQVFLGDTEQTVLSVSPTEIRFLTSPAPEGTCSDQSFALTVKSVVTGVESTEDLSFTYLSGNPVVAAISPSSRTVSGGGTATITGSNFGIGGGGVTVRFGNSTSAGATVIGANTVSAPIPAYSGTLPSASCDDNGDGVAGVRFSSTTVSVTVSNLPQGCSDTTAGLFTYTPTSSACVEPARCSNGIDDDGDTFIDFPADPECSGPNDDNEAS